jgi:hypothetical protein
MWELPQTASKQCHVHCIGTSIGRGMFAYLEAVRPALQTACKAGCHYPYKPFSPRQEMSENFQTNKRRCAEGEPIDPDPVLLPELNTAGNLCPTNHWRFSGRSAWYQCSSRELRMLSPHICDICNSEGVGKCICSQVTSTIYWNSSHFLSMWAVILWKYQLSYWFEHWLDARPTNN